MWGALVETGPPGLASFAAAYAAMLVIPGPSFAVVSHASVTATRREAALVATGVACGASLLTVLLLRGAASLPASELQAELGRLACTLLLLVVGFRAIRRSLLPTALAVAHHGRAGRLGHFAVGLVTAVTNPISFAFFSSVALAMRAGGEGAAGALLPAGVFVMAFGWFGCLTVLLSQPAIKALYNRSARRLDGVMGAMLIVVACWWLVPPG